MSEDLDKLTVSELNELAEKGDIDDIIGRETEIDDIAHILSLIHN